MDPLLVALDPILILVDPLLELLGMGENILNGLLVAFNSSNILLDPDLSEAVWRTVRTKIEKVKLKIFLQKSTQKCLRTILRKNPHT